MSIADDLSQHDLKEELPPELHGPERAGDRARWKYQRYMRDYLQTVQSVDDNVGRVLDHLDRAGLAENTIVVYTSDQGFFLGDHGWYDKRLMYDEALQMPLLIRWPAEIPAGSRCDAMVTNVDFAATFLDLCGLDPQSVLPQQQGRSFRALLRGEEVPDWPEAVYYRYWEHDDPDHAAPAHYGIRTRRFKYIDYYGDGLDAPGASQSRWLREYELFDLEADPAELRNVIDDPAYAEVLAELRDQLDRLQSELGDTPYDERRLHPRWSPSGSLSIPTH